jgi:Ca-activated chloride channel family protein
VRWLGWIALVALCGVVRGQVPNQLPNHLPDQSPTETQPLTTLSLQTKVVAVSAVVRDKKGAPVRDLTRQDFVLKDEGQVEEIRYFSQGSDLPLTLALMVDTSESQRMFIADETRASEIFFRTMLKRRQDRAVLVKFDRDILPLQPMTNSVEWLEQGLSRLSDPPPSGRPGWRMSTRLYDAVEAVSAQMLSREKGRRAMVLLTDGGDNGGHATLKDAVAAAQRADVVVYSIYYGPQKRTPETAAGQMVLSQLSDATGGRLFSVDQKTSLDQIYAQIEDDMRFQYQLGYRPPGTKPGEYRRIELKPVDRRYVVEARRGYYTPQ